MQLLSHSQQTLLKAVSQLAHCNPFLPERIELEKAALGSDFSDDTGGVWSKRLEGETSRPNIERLTKLAEQTADELRSRLFSGAPANGNELQLYEDLILYLLYYRYRDDLQKYIQTVHDGRENPSASFWNRFDEDFGFFLQIPNRKLPSGHNAAHLLACFFQVRRAFHHIYHFVLGSSMTAANLRASIWQSIFTHDMRRYRRFLYGRLSDVATLICGPSGTGKELVARAIGLSRFIAFDPEKQRFAANFVSGFHALNLSALSPTLIESELFGHQRGSFTGAVSDRVGWLEQCGSHGTIFLDEIGEVDVGLQVKLLRVLQTRTFQRLGDARDLEFEGKVVAATNRDLAAQIAAGRFREDLYYRLCADRIETPSLRQQLDDAPGDLGHLVTFIARRVAGDAAEELTDEVLAWIEANLDLKYAWPGNIRELEQCVRNIMIRKCYQPANASACNASGSLAEEFENGSLTADELLARYCALIYKRTGSYENAAKQLNLDRRTVKKKIEQLNEAGINDES
jgi:transcriptional regulator with AAA-type ATPase domain